MAQLPSQPGILAAVPAFGRSLSFSLVPEADPRAALRRLQSAFSPEHAVVGLGEPLTSALQHEIAGLCELLAPAFMLSDAVDTFVYSGGRDLTGYEDGTENPRDAAAVAAALVAEGEGLRGGSFVAVQRWVHDLQLFGAWPQDRRDATIGREREHNRELTGAPPTAHSKRAAQASYDPPAYMLRRSMPWASAQEQGLEFIAYGESLDRFERVLRRMLGQDDGVVDALFAFSRPVTGGYYFCPPFAGQRLDLRCLGL
ncbi:MAG TPA: Dyp-type peroxidase [Polyangiales bacterium]